MTLTAPEAPPTLDPTERLVAALGRIQGVATDMILAVGRNEPVASRDQLRLAAACDDVLAAVEAYQPTVLAAVVHLGCPTSSVLTTMPVADVPVDGSVEVRPVGGSGRFGPWVHVIGEQERAVGGEENRSLLIEGISEPFTWHRDQCVQVRPFRPVDEDLVEARHRARTGGL